MTKKLYARRDSEAQGESYTRHVMAMTTEALHSKAAIAGELAHRDITIERLAVALETVLDSLETLTESYAGTDVDTYSERILLDEVREGAPTAAPQDGAPLVTECLETALRALQRQALQSPDLRRTEWGQEALELAQNALDTVGRGT